MEIDLSKRPAGHHWMDVTPVSILGALKRQGYNNRHNDIFLVNNVVLHIAQNPIVISDDRL